MRRGLQDEARAPSQKTDEELQRLERERQKKGEQPGRKTILCDRHYSIVHRDTEDKYKGKTCLMGSFLLAATFSSCLKMAFLMLCKEQATREHMQFGRNNCFKL